MNLYSKCKLVLVTITVLSILPKLSYAITVYGIYTSSCKRDLGIVVDVDQNKVQLISLSGSIHTIPRYKIIYVAAYSIDSLSSLQVKNTHSLDTLQIETFQNDTFVELVKGWPVNYSKDTISFLNYKGHEIVITRDSIWKINVVPSPSVISFARKTENTYIFNHPYPFDQCTIEKNPTVNNKKAIKINPHTLMNDPVTIKRELDRLQKGRTKIFKYISWQQFYHVPHIYNNATSLGYWFSVNSRYGSSKARTSNLSPILQNEVSTGAFGYQHLLFTGSGPMFYSVHEEPQTQFYYRMKVDYVHAAIMFDPNRFLLPKDKYQWQYTDLNKFDDRIHQEYGGEIGFDYGYVSVQTHITSVPFGIRVNEFHCANSTHSIRAGITLHNHLGSIELQVAIPNKDGSDDEFHYPYGQVGTVYNDYTLNVYRLNITSTIIKKLELTYSLLYRELSFTSRPEYKNYFISSYQDNQKQLAYYQEQLEDITNSYYEESHIQSQISNYSNYISAAETAMREFEIKNNTYKSTSVTNALYARYKHNHKYSFGGFVAVEYHSYTYSGYFNSRKRTHVYPKGGIYASMKF